MSRDYVAEMRDLIDKETAHGPYSSPQVAQRIVADLRANDPELLDGWLTAQAEQFVRDAINLRDRSARSRTRHAAGRERFAEAAETGDVTEFLSLRFVVDDAGERKRLAEMTAGELTFTAEGYERLAADNAMTAAFLRALSKKVGRRTVGDVFDEAKLAELWRSLEGR